MPKLGTGGNAMALKMGAMLKCVLEGPGTAAPVPPPGAALRGRAGLAAARARASRAVQLCMPLPRLEVLGVGLQPALGPVGGDAG